MMYRIVIIICFAWILCGCMREMLFEDESLQTEEEIVMYQDGPFSFAYILRLPSLPSTASSAERNHRSIIDVLNGNRKAVELSYNQYQSLILMADEGLFNKSPLLRKLGNQLAQKRDYSVRLKFATYPNLEGDFSKHDAIYDASSQTVLLKTGEDIFSDRIILHEFLHVVQCELAGIKMTDKNEAHMEFEVMVLCDVIQTMIRKKLVASIDSEAYKGLVGGLSEPGYVIQVLSHGF